MISFHFSICPGTARRAGRLSTDFPSASITPTTPIQNASIIVTNTNTDCQQIQRTNNYKYKYKVSNQQYNGIKSISMTQIQIQSTGKCKYIYRNAEYKGKGQLRHFLHWCWHQSLSYLIVSLPERGFILSLFF